jgi:small subunit ribosomal protein S6
VSQRVYEILFIADPNLSEPDVDALTATLQAFVEKEGGKVEKVEKWGKKRLAYLVKRHREGSYVLLVAHGGSDMMREVERRIRVTDGVIKFMTVRVDEELKKADRRKAKRTAEDEKRRSRTPDRPAPASLPSVPAGDEVQL